MLTVNFISVQFAQQPNKHSLFFKNKSELLFIGSSLVLPILGFIRDPGGIQTPNPQSRNLMFYSVELRSQKTKILLFKF